MLVPKRVNWKVTRAWRVVARRVPCLRFFPSPASFFSLSLLPLLLLEILSPLPLHSPCIFSYYIAHSKIYLLSNQRPSSRPKWSLTSIQSD